MELTNKQTLELTNTRQSGETSMYKRMATKLRYNFFWVLYLSFLNCIQQCDHIDPNNTKCVIFFQKQLNLTMWFIDQCILLVEFNCEPKMWT